MGAVRALGEVALRVKDLEAMAAFYEDVIGLERIAADFKEVVFFRVAEGHGGHTAVVALFRDEGDRSAERSTLHHLAFTIDLVDHDAERERLEAAGCTVRTAVHEWVGWRSLYVDDPEGNEVEFVCFDRTALEE